MKEHLIAVAALTGGCAFLYYYYFQSKGEKASRNFIEENGMKRSVIEDKNSKNIISMFDNDLRDTELHKVNITDVAVKTACLSPTKFCDDNLNASLISEKQIDESIKDNVLNDSTLSDGKSNEVLNISEVNVVQAPVIDDGDSVGLIKPVEALDCEVIDVKCEEINVSKVSEVEEINVSKVSEVEEIIEMSKLSEVEEIIEMSKLNESPTPILNLKKSNQHSTTIMSQQSEIPTQATELNDTPTVTSAKNKDFILKPEKYEMSIPVSESSEPLAVSKDCKETKENLEKNDSQNSVGQVSCSVNVSSDIPLVNDEETSLKIPDNSTTTNIQAPSNGSINADSVNISNEATDLPEVTASPKAKSKKQKKKTKKINKEKEIVKENGECCKENVSSTEKLIDTNVEICSKNGEMEDLIIDNEVSMVDENINYSKSNDKNTSKDLPTNLKENFPSLPLKKEEAQSSQDSPTNSTSSDLEIEATPEQENGVSDSQSLVSQGSFDSGQGSIEVDHDANLSNGNAHHLMKNKPSSDHYIFYQFEICQDLVGRLIGKKGNFINRVKNLTSTSAVVTDHVNAAYKLCSIEGKRNNVIQALKLIRDHFPLNDYPELTLAQVNTPQPSPQHQPPVNDRPVAHVELPAGVVVEVTASFIASTGEVWLQQPLHPTHAALSRLHQCLRFNYGDGTSAPVVPIPIPAGTICVCFYDNQWLRCEVLEHDQEFCTAILLDVGGIVRLQVKVLRQIRVDYAELPFQARQTILHGIEPINGSYTEEGRLALESFVKKSVTFATIAAYSADGVPLINLYQRNSNQVNKESFVSQYTFINEKLVELGHAKWTTPEALASS